MVGWRHRLNGHKFEQTLGDSEGQGSLACCSSWGCRVGHDLVTEQQQLMAQWLGLHASTGVGEHPGLCKTQNLGLRSEEEKPRDPINQPNRCNMHEGLLSVAQTGDSDLLGGRAH